MLNISYVITSSTDFGKTLDKVVSGLNDAGSSNKDYRAKDVEPEPEQPSNIRLTHCKNLIQAKIAKLNCVNDKELQEFIDRVIDTLTADQLSDNVLYVGIDTCGDIGESMGKKSKRIKKGQPRLPSSLGKYDAS